MYDRNRLEQMILEHWKKYRPQMVEDLQRANELDQAIYEVQDALEADVHPVFRDAEF